MALTIITNNHQRDLLAGYELPAGVWDSEFSYLGAWSEENDSAFTPRFLRYMNSWYDVLDGFEATSWNSGLRTAGWDVFQSDTYFSGIAIRWGKDWAGITDYATVVVARVAFLD